MNHRLSPAKEHTMGFFSNILEKLGLGAASKADSVAAASAAADATANAIPTSPDATAAPSPISLVDVVGHIEQRAAASAQSLNWQTSIVDLLKLLDIDSSLTARKELATELDCPQALLQDSASMNTWLHKEMLQRIAANGGNVPEELLS
jgi:hypothetical protein